MVSAHYDVDKREKLTIDKENRKYLRRVDFDVSYILTTRPVLLLPKLINRLTVLIPCQVFSNYVKNPLYTENIAQMYNSDQLSVFYSTGNKACLFLTKPVLIYCINCSVCCFHICAGASLWLLQFKCKS